MPITINPLTPTLGIELSGPSGHDVVDRAVANECAAALDQYGVVVIHDANIDDEDLVA